MSKRWYQLCIRFFAMILSVCIIGCQLLPGMSVIAYASSELTNEDLGNGASEATAYKWIGPRSGTGETGGNSYRFDLCGLQAGQIEYSTSGIQTTYGWQGYATYLQVDGGTIYKANGNTNGAVEELASMGVELKIAVSPSPDDKYVFVDYYVYDKNGQGGTNGRSVKLGTGTDVMIGSGSTADNATIYKNDRGFHMVNSGTQETFDCITNDSSLGVTPPTTRWISYYSSWGANVFNEGGGSSLSGTDSAMAYSWSFQLHPYEVVHRRVAFAIRDTSYYVSSTGSDSSSAQGTYSSPYKTIEYALNKIGNKKGYIYVMDYPDIVAPITISGSSKDITIASTDFDSAGNPTSENSDYIKTLKRADSYTGSVFNVSSGTIKFTDIILDGNGVETSSPLISAANGTVEINSGAVVKNCNGTSTGSGSAVEITGAANLSMNYGTVKDNISNGKGAVYFDSNGSFSVKNLVTIEDNVNSSGEKNNAYLAQGKRITVNGDLDASRIGVTAEQIPDASVGDSTVAGHEVVIAVPSADYSGSITSCPFADNFFADKDTGNGTGIYTAIGSSALNNSRNTVLKRNGYTVSFAYQDSATGGTVTGAPDTPSQSFASGEGVVISPPSAISGYDFTGIAIDQGTGSTLTAIETAGADFGKITGTMPGQDVVVTYECTRIDASIAFVVNGGTPQPQTLAGTAGNSVNALFPSVSRYGYVFKGWSKVNSQTSPEYISSLPAVYPESPVTYYAIWESDPGVKFDYTVDYTNQNGSIVFQSTTTANTYSVESVLQSQKKNIHGYLWSLLDSLTSPAEYNYDGLGAVPIGTFNGSTGEFTGRMPGQDAAVKYAYKVDRNNPAARSDLTVRYVTENGTVIHTPGVTAYYPEDAISTSPLDIYGYQFVSGSITAGDTADDTDGNLVSAVQGSFGSSGGFTGVMPNQPVEITYVYEATGEGYRFTVNYLDNNTTDNNLRNIVIPEVQQKTADTAVSAEYRDLYGYSYESAAAVPDSSGSFDTGHDYTGTMPSDDLTVSYGYDRVQSQWAWITYKSGINGAISHGSGVSSDVQEQGSGT
ncbi:MucBP domain-containing protein, partial [Lacrimispora sp.]|uniref:MucBP domain-containing protein n=1 Tax=Lacrimispora sp. TaxID=2719234 RepID=UPI003FA610A6